MKRGERIIYTKEELINEYEKYLITNKMSYISFMSHNFKELAYYVIEEKLKFTDDQILKIERNWFKKYKFYGVLLNSFNGSTTAFIDYLYPNRFMPWQFITVGVNYWKDINNKKYALNWLVEQLFKDNIINEIEEIPIKVNGDIFKHYKLSGLLHHQGFKGHSFYAFDFLYPNMFYEWEYNFTVEGYWDIKENRIKALKQLLENRLHINIYDIPKLISFIFFDWSTKYHKFKSICEKYYNLDIWKWIEECYPKEFNKWEVPYKNNYICLDNNIVKSEPERILQNIFINTFDKFTYCSEYYDEYSFYDEISDSNFTPDWLIPFNDKLIIVEYYGYLRKEYYGSFAGDIGYIDKYNNKDRYYKDLVSKEDNYIYISLNMEDIKHGFKGVINKFKEYNIQLKLGLYDNY